MHAYLGPTPTRQLDFERKKTLLNAFPCSTAIQNCRVLTYCTYIGSRYSAHPNRRTCTVIYFEQKVHPIRSYFGRVRLFDFGKTLANKIVILNVPLSIMYVYSDPVRLLHSRMYTLHYNSGKYDVRLF